MSKYRLILFTMFFLSFSANPALSQELNKSKDWVKELRELPPLPKIHYSWPLPEEFFNDTNNPLLYEIARITHTVCLGGEKATDRQIDIAVYTCARLNKTDPNILCSIGINYSPEYDSVKKEWGPTYRGKEYFQELELFTSKLNHIKKVVEDSNIRYLTNVKVTAILLDFERFEIKENDPVWNEGLRDMLDATHMAAQQIYPDARIEWYGRGQRRSKVTPYWTGKEIKAPLSCSLYTLPKIDEMRTTFKKTCRIADKLGIIPVTPWVALAGGYIYGNGVPIYWQEDWDYDLKYSYQMGLELNSNVGDYKRAEVIVFYPNPFAPKYPNWPKHFVAYVKGALGLKNTYDPNSK